MSLRDGRSCPHVLASLLNTQSLEQENLSWSIIEWIRSHYVQSSDYHTFKLLDYHHSDWWKSIYLGWKDNYHFWTEIAYMCDLEWGHLIHTCPLSFPLEYILSNQPLDYILFLYLLCLQNLMIIIITISSMILLEQVSKKKMFLLEQKPLSCFKLCWGFTNKICAYYKERQKGTNYQVTTSIY